MPFIMVLIKLDKKGKLRLSQIGENIASILLDKFFDYFNCMEKNVIWWSFNIKDLIYKRTKKLYI